MKTDRRDALQLARLMRAGALTPVYVPTVEAEAMRALTRARQEASSDLKDAQVRLKACLLRHAIRSTGQATWHPERLQRLEQERQEPGKSWRLTPVVEALQALRGVQFPGAVPPGAALGDLTRVENPRPLMAYLGLTPSASSSGERRRQGAITKAGNPHARRGLVEGAWAYRYPATVSRPLHLRREKPPKAIQDRSWKAQVRLGKRYRTLLARGQHANQVVVAIARELVGFMGAIAKQVPVPPSLLCSQ